MQVENASDCEIVYIGIIIIKTKPPQRKRGGFLMPERGGAQCQRLNFGRYSKSSETALRKEVFTDHQTLVRRKTLSV